MHINVCIFIYVYMYLYIYMYFSVCMNLFTYIYIYIYTCSFLVLLLLSLYYRLIYNGWLMVENSFHLQRLYIVETANQISRIVPSKKHPVT